MPEECSFLCSFSRLSKEIENETHGGWWQQKTRNRSAQNVRSQLPKTVSLFENKGKLQPGNGEETLAKTILRRFSGFLFLLSSSLF